MKNAIKILGIVLLLVVVLAAAAAGLACIGIYEPHSAPYADELKARTAIFFEDYAAFLLWLGVEPGFCAAKPS